MSELSPAAKAVMIAATNGNANVVNDPVYRQCTAAALRAATDQVVPANGSRKNNEIRAELLAIAAELEVSND